MPALGAAESTPPQNKTLLAPAKEKVAPAKEKVAPAQELDSGMTPVITIEANSFDLFVDAEKVVFRGDVNASQGNHTFRTSQLTVHLDQVNTKSGSTVQEDGSAAGPNDVPFELSAAHLYYQDHVVTGSGDSRLRRGRELILAEVIHYDVLERIAFARPDDNGRVFVRFFSNPDMPLFPTKPLPRVAAAE